jgi:hypothetical protein
VKLVHADEAPPLFEFDEPLLDEPLLSEFDEDDPPLSVDGGLLSLDGGCCD